MWPRLVDLVASCSSSVGSSRPADAFPPPAASRPSFSHSFLRWHGNTSGPSQSTKSSTSLSISEYWPLPGFLVAVATATLFSQGDQSAGIRPHTGKANDRPLAPTKASSQPDDRQQLIFHS
eukprot:GHVT01088468.1.p1 GENE.GHVT01088468.1~~GHVT01088468.1.p1  ORF type:complete len:121 (+),score=16.72 GHVT01088468.1:422-784(+)